MPTSAHSADSLPPVNRWHQLLAGIVCMVMITKFGPRVVVMFGGIVVAIAW
jgi:hypothetical protein